MKLTKKALIDLIKDEHIDIVSENLRSMEEDLVDEYGIQESAEVDLESLQGDVDLNREKIEEILAILAEAGMIDASPTME